MAIDSREKRAAAISAGIPFIVIAPLTDGTISAADRAQMADVYSGITIGEEVAVTTETRIGMMMLTIMKLMRYIPY